MWWLCMDFIDKKYTLLPLCVSFPPSLLPSPSSLRSLPLEGKLATNNWVRESTSCPCVRVIDGCNRERNKAKSLSRTETPFKSRWT